MKIELLSQTRARMFLTQGDMDALNIDYERLGGFDEYTQNAIVALLEQIKKQHPFDLSQGKLYVEVFPNAQNGCVFYFTLKGESKPPKEREQSLKIPCLLRIKGANHLVACASFLQTGHRKHLQKSHLYAYQNAFILVLFPKNKQFAGLHQPLAEFGQFLDAPLAYPFLQEHAKPLILDIAVEKLYFLLA